jgi:hypothetical protein
MLKKETGVASSEATPAFSQRLALKSGLIFV